MGPRLRGDDETHCLSFLLLLSRPKDQQYAVIVHLRFLMSLRSQFTSNLDESMRGLYD